MPFSKLFITILIICICAGCSLFSTVMLNKTVQMNIVSENPNNSFLHVTCTVPVSENTPKKIRLYFKNLPLDNKYIRNIQFSIPKMNYSIKENARTKALDILLINSPHNENIEFSYEINTYYYPHFGRIRPEKHAKAVCWLNNNMGIICSKYIFPCFTNMDAEVKLNFSLPNNWTTVTPWDKSTEEIHTTLSRLPEQEYLGIGPMNISNLTVKNIDVTIGTHHEIKENTGTKKIITEVICFFGSNPQGKNKISTIVAPNYLVQGGSSGFSSIVYNGKHTTLTHEFFHFWNHGNKFNRKSSWFVEGVTTYYGLKLTKQCGLISEDDMQASLADLEAEMKIIEKNYSSSLRNAGINSNNRYYNRLIYSKGALLCWYLDCQLEKEGSSLDTFVRSVLIDHKVQLHNRDIIKIWEKSYNGKMTDVLKKYILQDKHLPELELPDPTGKTGISYFYP